MTDEALRDKIAEALHVECPVHRMRDCGPLLNGCRWPATMREQQALVAWVVGEHYRPLLDAADELADHLEAALDGDLNVIDERYAQSAIRRFRGALRDGGATGGTG